MTITTDRTDEVLAAMLVENTGRALCDSGDAYGRNWQHNQGLTVETLLARPAITAEVGNRYLWDSEAKRNIATGEKVVDYITLDVFHFLRERCTYEPDLDAALHAFAEQPEYERESWFAIRNEWLESIGAVGGIDHSGEPNVVNTYNGEDSLSQTIEYALFDLPDDDRETYVVLMVHGGCDVRGGYTAPRVFSLGWYGGYSLFDNARFTAILRSPDGNGHVMLDYSDGGYYVDNVEGDDGDDITFKVGETPIVEPGEGDTVYVIADGPAKGWEVSFHEWPAG